MNLKSRIIEIIFSVISTIQTFETRTSNHMEDNMLTKYSTYLRLMFIKFVTLYLITKNGDYKDFETKIIFEC